MTSAIQSSVTTTTYVLTLSIKGDLRFISHHDTVRMLVRAAVRAQIPLAYTQGFNPHPRISLPVPRSVGMSTCGDLVVLRLDSEQTPETVLGALSAQMPQGAQMTNCERLAPSHHKIDIMKIRYELPINKQQENMLTQAIEQFCQSEEVVVQRNDEKGNRRSPLDIRPFVDNVRIQDSQLTFVGVFVDGRTVAPKDLIGALGLGWDECRHLICRKEVEWKP